MNGVIFLPENLQRKIKNRKFCISVLIIFLICNIFLLLFFYLPYNNLMRLEKENNRLKQKYSIKDKNTDKELSARSSQQKRLNIILLIKNEKQKVGENLNVFRGIHNKNITIETIIYENSVIALQGESNNYYSIIAFLKYINDSKLYKMARLTKVDCLDQKNLFMFQMNIKLKE